MTTDEIVAKAHQVPLQQMFEALGSGSGGLTSEEARLRLTQYGPNLSRVAKTTPLVLKFLRQFKNLFAILLMVGGALALLGERLDPGQGNLYIAIALYLVVLLNALFTLAQQYQSDRILASFQRMLAPMANVLRDGEQRRIPAKELVAGDVLVLQEGDGIAADARLIEQHGMKVDLSSLTGESEPRLRHLECTHDNILESRNMVFSGTLVQAGDGTALVYATGMATQIQAAAGFFAFFVVLHSGGWTMGQQLANDDPLYRVAVSAFFASIIICQVADVMICRTRRASILSVGVFSNRLLLVGIASELVLLGLIVYMPLLNKLFGTAPLAPWHFLLSVPFAVVIVLADEVRRYFVRRESPFVLRWLTW